MKKKLSIALIGFFVLLLAACGGKEEKEDTIKIGASSTPHAEILEQAKPILEDEGIKLEIEEYQDYNLPNDDVDSGDIDANFHQHIPYLEQTNKDTGYDLVNIGEIHIEPMGIYSKNIKSKDDIKKGTEVIMSSSFADKDHILTIFEEEGLIKLKDVTDKDSAETKDMTENKLDIDSKAAVDPGLQPEIYEKEKDALVAINTNYAI